MSEQQEAIESSAPPEVQAAAEKQGWIPATRYKGPPEKFVDADAYLDNAEKVLPLVKKHLTTALGDVEALKQQNAQLAATLRETQESIEDIKEAFTVDTQKRVEAARKDLKAEIRAARKAGNDDIVDQLTDDLEELDEAERKAREEAPKEKRVEKPVEPPAIDPATQAWINDHPWFGSDKRKTAIYMGFVQARRADGDRTTGQAFFDKALEDMETELEGAKPASKVEGGKGGSGGNSGGGKRQDYASMPAEAKQACDAEARQFVGPNKRYKTNEEWQKQYAKIYYRDN